jgi:hypothetical protein
MTRTLSARLKANEAKGVAKGRRLAAVALKTLADEYFEHGRADDDATSGAWAKVVEKIRAVDTTLATDADSVKGEAGWMAEERAFLAGLQVGLALMAKAGAR